MKTRDKILTKAQELFNKNGIGKVSVRNICEEMSISLGNFTYHFPDKQKIVIELYYKMIEEIEAVEKKVTTSKDSILFLLEYHKQVFAIQNSYRFFYLNTFELLNNSHQIKEAYQMHVEKENSNMQEMLQFYTEKGVLQELPPNFLKKLVTISQMVNSFWMIDAELQFKGKAQKKLLHYLELCCSLIEPFLTAPAQKEFRAYFASLES